MAIFYSPTTKGFYDTSINYPNLPDDLIEVTVEQRDAFIEVMNNNNKELALVDNELVLVDAAPIAPTWSYIRVRRNDLLASSDYTQIADWSGNKEAWATYRQDLRNIPQTFAAPEDVIWPTPPGS
jgi:hypothetical protein